MTKTPRDSGSVIRRTRAIVLLLCVATLSGACGDESNIAADVADGASEELPSPDVLVGSDSVDASGEISEISESDALETETTLEDVAQDVPTDLDVSLPDASDVSPTQEVTDATADGEPLEVTDGASDSTSVDATVDSLDAGEVTDEPCVPGEPCALDLGWDCVEGICTSLGSCAPTPIAECCITDIDCSNLDPPNACASFSCVNTVCTPKQVPGCCTTTQDCSDNEPCTLDQCPQPGALCIHCPAGCPCPQTPPAYSTGFDEGYFPLGWIVSDANLGDDVGWHVSGRRWVRPPYGAYMGDADCGTYSNAPLDGACEPLPLPGTGGTKITSTLKTPSIPLLSQPGGHVLLFWLWSEVDPLTTGGPGESDVLSVRVQNALTQESWPLASSLAVGKNTGGLWAMLGADLSPWTGLNVRLLFEFDTLQNLDNLHEGVYVDDIQVVPRCVGGCCNSDVDCGGLPLDDGCSQAKCIDLEGGAGTVCAAVPTTPGEACQACSDDGECADGNPCTTDSCSSQGICEHTVFCCFEENAFATSFEEDMVDFYLGDSNGEDAVGWKLTNEHAVLGFSSAWIADPTTSNYESGDPIDASLTTPSFTLAPASGVGGSLGAAFWLNLSTEWDGQLYANPAGIDRLSVSVVQGPVSTEVWSSDAIGGSTSGLWESVEIDLEDWAAAPIQLRFAFKTTDNVNNAFVGPIIDALKVGRICPLD
jgi:hypothetical protein